MSGGDTVKKEKLYLAGRFGNWRDGIIRALGDKYEIIDPRDHRQNAIAKLVEDDMSGSRTSPITLTCLPRGTSPPTMTFAENGGSRARGNCIIVVDENENHVPLFEKIASYSFTDRKKAVSLLRGENAILNALYPRISRKEKEVCKNVLFAGNIDAQEIDQVIHTTSKTKGVRVDYDLGHLEDFGEDVDLLVVNFERGPRCKKAIFYMGLCYTLDIPVVLCTGNPIVYPPLAGLARRIFTDNERHDVLQDYLRDLDSLKIEDEAQIMYGLFEKYHS